MPVPRAADPAPRRFLSQEAYDRLLAALLDGSFAHGERLQDTELEAWLGISRTPLRQALERLAEEGFIETSANRFTRVASPDAREFLHVSLVLTALQIRAVRGSLPTATDEQLAEVESLAAAAAADPELARGSLTPSSLGQLRALSGYFAERSPHRLLRRESDSLAARASFMAHGFGGQASPDALRAFLVEYPVRIRARDVEGAAALLRGLGVDEAQRFAARIDG